jgi:putative molybdopterin biosynthesis protein
MSGFQPHLYEEIAEALRRQIASGELAAGARLPSVRATAAQWNCTTGTVTRAFAMLAEEGLIQSNRGGGTRVTELPLPENNSLAWATLVNQAERFLLEVLGQGYTEAQVQTAVSVALARWHTLQENLPVKPPAPLPGDTLRFTGSHDLTMELLGRQLAAAYPACQLTLNFRGSLGGLFAIARGDADIAGIHLWDESSDTYNTPFVRRVLPGQRIALLTVANRSIGLLTPPGNPQALQSLTDLTRKDVQWINRQAGSGTRVWLDAQLQRLQIDHRAIQGYADEKATHLQVAQTIVDKKATAGLGLQAAAASYGLGFVPLTEEPYQLVIPEQIWGTQTCRRLVETLQSAEFKTAVDSLHGYDSTPTGDVVWIT